jgi:predicted glycoside hydrolase/deacetylase ChbG (UPF0249 family)
MKNNSRKNLIFSADDFGLNPKANQNILLTAEKGKIDRVSVMAFGKMTPEDIERLKKSGVKLDLHLHLERFRVDAFENNGAHQWIGKRILIFLKIYFSRRGAAAKKEWGEQFEEFRRIFGRDPDGLNSHEHIHFFPAYFKVAYYMRMKRALPYFRLGKKGSGCFGMTSLILNFLRSRNIKKIKKELPHFPTSQYFASFDWFSCPDDIFRQASDKDSLEIVFHPERDEEVGFLMKS